MLRSYQRSWLRGDLLAGVAVAAYLIPQVMAYAQIAGLPAVAGLMAACGALIVYAVLGSSRQLSVGPESTTALLTAATGMPAPAVPQLSMADLGALALPALGVAVVAYSDNVLTGRAFAARHSQTVNANSELLALGVSNLVAGFLRGFPVSSSGSRTAIGDAQGSRTQLHSLVVVTVLLTGGSVLAGFPLAALGAVVVYAALRLIDAPAFERIARFRLAELVLALTTTAAVLIFGVLYGVLAAVGLSVVELLRRLARPHDAILGFVPGVAGMHDIDDYPQARLVPGLVVYRYDAPLCFANAEDFRHRALAAVAAAPTPVCWFLLNAEANVEVDSTAVDALQELRAELDRCGVVFAMARVKQDLRDQLARTDFLDAVGTNRIFMTLPTAVAAYWDWHVRRFGAPPAGQGTAPKPE